MNDNNICYHFLNKINVMKFKLLVKLTGETIPLHLTIKFKTDFRCIIL